MAKGSFPIRHVQRISSSAGRNYTPQQIGILRRLASGQCESMKDLAVKFSSAISLDQELSYSSITILVGKYNVRFVAAESAPSMSDQLVNRYREKIVELRDEGTSFNGIARHIKEIDSDFPTLSDNAVKNAYNRIQSQKKSR